jgi:hypothetical protein
MSSWSQKAMYDPLDKLAALKNVNAYPKRALLEYK